MSSNLPPVTTASSRRKSMTSSRLLAPRGNLVDLVLAVLLVVGVGLSYGAFAAIALRSAQPGGVLHVSDFDTAGADPWQTPFGSGPPGQSLAHLGARTLATP